MKCAKQDQAPPLPGTAPPLTASGLPVAKPPTLTEVIDAVCREYATDHATILGDRNARQGAEMRAVAAWVVQNLDGLTLTSLAVSLNQDLSALSRAAGRLRQRMTDNEPLKMRAEKIVRLLRVSNSQA